MPSIEQSGRTVDEAVEVALKALGVSREEVEVEVLAKESRGLLGILGTTEARVRVTTVSADAAPDAAPDAVPAAGADAQSDAGPDVSPGLTGPGLSDVSVLAQRAVEL
ncbi:MAG: Jag N-terminal domain-containing protein, partial [Proteobacteria bacterium]|nr:Jag N-terminal domain-containing protein [Pseudomonadota bacterium]